MQKKEYYTSAEAVARFLEEGLSETTFRRRVKENVIIGKLPEGRVRGALYPKKQVEDAIRQSRRKSEAEGTIEQTNRGQTDWAKSSDLPYMLAYDYELYGPENTVDISITHAWWEKNPFMARILFDMEDRRNIWGGITIMPMEEEVIFRLLRDEMQEREIRPEHILTYESGKKYYGYIASATVKETHKAHFRKLVMSVMAYWCEHYPDIQLIKLYAYSASEKGLDLIRYLFFSPRYDLGENAFELDPYRRNPSKLVKHFQQCLEQKKLEI